MLTPFIRVILLTGLLTACAHRGAARVECNGPLRPINAPMPPELPVSVTPAPAAPIPDREPQP